MDVLERLNFSKALEELLPSLISGMGIVAQATIIGFLLAIVLGFLIALGRLSHSKILNTILVAFLELIRGTPLLVQLVYIFYVVPLLAELFLYLVFGIEMTVRISSIVAGISGLTINYGCYLSEVIRSAIIAIDEGQTEASLALGLSRTQTMFKIILPQAFRNSVPVFGNYLVMMVKDTSLLSYVTVQELLLRTKSYAAQSFLTIESYTFLALAYLVISIPLSHLVKVTERKLDKSRR